MQIFSWSVHLNFFEHFMVFWVHHFLKTSISRTSLLSVFFRKIRLPLKECIIVLACYNSILVRTNELRHTCVIRVMLFLVISSSLSSDIRLLKSSFIISILFLLLDSSLILCHVYLSYSSKNLSVLF